ncbi:MAG: uracil-DNA glycosylase [Chloroflexota bacterium]|nr:uracil-DNA glycosylase [Chloroflexota bacterium]
MRAKEAAGGTRTEEQAGIVDKQAAWDALKGRAAERLGPGMVFGEGPLDARFVITGEAPGEQEAAAGRPFVGRAGQLLNRLLKEAGIDRAQVYVTNVVKLRPTVEAGGRLKNRPPRAPEIKAGLEILLPELEIVGPDALILFGNVPAKALIGKAFAMGANRGVWFQSTAGLPALATYHPAYILRLEGPDFDRTREVVVNDLIAARQALESPPEAKKLA